jgi:hypothetical protein
MGATLHPQTCLASFTKTRSIWSYRCEPCMHFVMILMIWLGPVWLRTGLTSRNAGIGACSNRRAKGDKRNSNLVTVLA